MATRSTSVHRASWHLESNLYYNIIRARTRTLPATVKYIIIIRFSTRFFPEKCSKIRLDYARRYDATWRHGARYTYTSDAIHDP